MRASAGPSGGSCAGSGFPLAVCVAVGAGECFYTATLMPLTAELAPEGLRGRYMAALGFSWWAGLAIAPALGGPLLSRSPAAVFTVAAAASAAAGVALLRLEPRLPARARRTPRPGLPGRPGPNRGEVPGLGHPAAGPEDPGQRGHLLRVHGGQWCPKQARAGGRSRRSKISE